MEVTKRDILRDATEAQRLGSDPGWSAWVSASAGSGKTKVLGDRVLRLLLGNVPPAKILCLTFTKAAAAEMSNRVAERLAPVGGRDRRPSARGAARADRRTATSRR